MSGLIVIRTEVKVKHLNIFMDQLSAWHINIAKIYLLDNIVEIIFGVEHMGYAEPIEFYNDIKKCVTDVWYCCVGDADLKPGKDSKQTWYSCKKEIEEQK